MAVRVCGGRVGDGGPAGARHGDCPVSVYTKPVPEFARQEEPSLRAPKLPQVVRPYIPPAHPQQARMDAYKALPSAFRPE